MFLNELCKMKIFQILQGVGNPSAGPTYSVGALSHYLAANKNDVTVVALGNPPSVWPHQARLQLFSGASVRYGLAPLESIRFVRKELVREPGILHGHGVWRISNLFPLIIRKTDPVKLIWSPRGMFTEWSWNYRASIKRPFWYLLQKPALNKVHCFHATAQSECDDIRRVGFLQPVAVIPNGVDIPLFFETPRKNKAVVFLSRIHPKKGLHLLVNAWAEIAGVRPDWELLIAGKVDSAYGRQLVQMVNDRRIPRVRFLGEVLGGEKTELLARAHLFVLPTFSENFGIAIAEALAHGTPVITTMHTPWEEVQTRGCGWIIRAEVSALKDALLKALSLSESELNVMGQKGRNWVKNAYSWPKVSDMMQELYIWQLEGGARPQFVTL